MENLDTLFVAGIFLLAFLGFQFGIIYFLLNALIDPIKKDISRLESRQVKLEAGQGRIEALLKKGNSFKDSSEKKS